MTAITAIRPPRRRAFAALAAVVAGCGALVLSDAAFAATYAPNKLGDHAPNGCTHSDCTLREAITKANNHPGPDAIVLKGGKTYNLSLANVAGEEDANATGDLDVLESLTIKSSNKKLATVDANGIDRVFEVGTSAPVSATFKRVSIKGGHAQLSAHGGGIDSEYGGTLKLIKSKVVGNRTDAEGGGIAADGGTLKIIRSLIGHNNATNPFQNAGGIEGEPGSTQNEVISISRSKIVDNHAGSNGGAIYAYNRLTINHSTLRGNTAGDTGGAIYNFGVAATISRSTIAGNRAGAGGGGVYAFGEATITRSTVANNDAGSGVGGGIWNDGGNLVLTSSTLNGNTTDNDGGGVEVYYTARLVNDTITKNHASSGGGIDTDAIATTLNAVTVARNSASASGGGINEESQPVTLRNSLIALNSTGGVGPDCYNAITPSAGHNLIGDTADCTGIFGPATNDIMNVNPRIAQLANNGGPTKTIALRRHSKAINHAGNDAPSRDQRGVKRHNPDIGAFERR